MPDVRFVDVNLADWLRARETPTRSVGHHVSDVVVRLLQAASRKFDHYGKGEIDLPRETGFRLGFAWEDLIAEVLRLQMRVDEGAGLILPPHELYVRTAGHDLYGTPDRVIFGRSVFYPDAPSLWRVEETKVTWMSNRDLQQHPRAILEVPKFAYWVLQLKTYAAMVANPDVRYRAFAYTAGNIRSEVPLSELLDPTPPCCILRALFVNGPYRGFQPEPLCWRIEWSLEELETHSQMIADFLDHEQEPRHDAGSVDPAAPTGDAAGGPKPGPDPGLQPE